MLATLCLSGCGSSDPVGGSGSSPDEGGGEVAWDRSCDLAPFPSLRWEQCEIANFAKQLEAPTEALNPVFAQRLLAQNLTNTAELLARAADDPSWLGLPSGNLPVLPYCAPFAAVCTGDPFRYPQAVGPDGDAFYRNEADVIPVVFYDRDCTRLSGRVWAPRNSPAPASLPHVVIANGSLGASETAYWWASQALVRGGYAVMTFDPRGQGRSDFLSPSGQLGTNANLKVFWDEMVDAIDFFHSTPQQLYPHNQTCAGTYPTTVAPFNPVWNRIDRERLGIAGHSAGAVAVSVVQGYGAPGADPWPGKLDASNPVKVGVAWDSLIAPDATGLAPCTNSLPVPPGLCGLLVQAVITQGNLPKFGPRVPAMSFNADYALVWDTPYVLPPDAEGHKGPYKLWQTDGVPVYSLGFQGTTHEDYSPIPAMTATSWCPDTTTGACRGGYAQPAIVHYTLAWFDRWLKQPGEPGYADADARLLDDGGPQGADKLSFRYRSARDFPDRSGRRQRCEDIRGGCKE
ncbi:hypothetical protein D0B54_21735 [Solimonas sp. K1W22B-7]|nr:hypothetical protein D0B54_21735 [Solimonas sp. K1W22B-7]